MLGDPRLREDDDGGGEDDDGKAGKANAKMPGQAGHDNGRGGDDKEGTEDDNGGYLFASSASIAFASAIISGEAPSFSKTLMALDSPFASPALKKCSPKVS